MQRNSLAADFPTALLIHAADGKRDKQSNVMQIGELVAVSVSKDVATECPFDHSESPHNESNALSNNASTLGSRLGGGGDNFEVEIMVDGSNVSLTAGVAAHHLIPGNESFLRAGALLKYVKKGSEIKGDIGYDINNPLNGYWLPGNYQWPVGRFGKWSQLVTTYKSGNYVQVAYAFACMDKKASQFHDRHEDYSAWVKMTLEKIRIQILALQSDCDVCDQSAKPHNPPYKLVDIINALSRKLVPRITGSPRNWKYPFFTSRFAVLYSLGYEPDETSPVGVSK